MNTVPEKHVFVVKVWRAATPGTDGLRASVFHVASGRRLATAQLRDVEDFMRLRLKPADAEPDAPGP